MDGGIGWGQDNVSTDHVWDEAMWKDARMSMQVWKYASILMILVGEKSKSPYQSTDQSDSRVLIAEY